VQTDLIQNRINDISDRIRRVREVRSLTLVQLGQLSDVAPSTIQKIENRQMTPSITVLLKIAAGLGVEPPELIAPTKPEVFEVLLQRAKQHSRIKASKNLVFEKLSSDIADAGFECWRVMVGPHHQAEITPPWPLDEHIFLCETGVVELTMDGHVYALREGDSLHFKAKTIYRVANPGEHPSAYIFAGKYPHGFRNDLVSGLKEASV
jgi:transcriptional regulator with XRE-family HTH domain